MELREYQYDLINNIRNEIIKEKRTICAVLGCGGGKSVIQGKIAQSATQKKERSVVYRAPEGTVSAD